MGSSLILFYGLRPEKSDAAKPYYIQIYESESYSVVSSSLRPHGLHSPWNSRGQNTGVGSLSLLQGIFPTFLGFEPRSPALQADSLPAEPQGKLSIDRLCIFTTSPYYLLLLLGPYCFCPFLCPSLHEMFPWYLSFFFSFLVNFYLLSE